MLRPASKPRSPLVAHRTRRGSKKQVSKQVCRRALSRTVRHRGVSRPPRNPRDQLRYHCKNRSLESFPARRGRPLSALFHRSRQSSCHRRLAFRDGTGDFGPSSTAGSIVRASGFVVGRCGLSSSASAIHPPHQSFHSLKKNKKKRKSGRERHIQIRF